MKVVWYVSFFYYSFISYVTVFTVCHFIYCSSSFIDLCTQERHFLKKK